ncbi:MAG: hypothetical protein AAB525_02460 [Patescibacteria group bacterium]
MLKTTFQPQRQITFNAPLALKEKALNKAREQGLTLKALLNMAMREYVNDNLLLSLRSKEDYYDEVFADKEVIAKANELGTLLAKKNL